MRSRLLSFTVYFVTTACIIVCKTYTDLLFLSTYPKSWLPYFFVAQTVVIIMLTLGVGPIISGGSRRSNCLFLLICSSVVLALWYLMAMDFNGLPFVLCLVLSALALLMSVVAWNGITDAFDVREFKLVAKWVNTAGSIGGLIVGLSIPAIIEFSGAEALLLVLVVLILLVALGILNLRPVAKDTKKKKAKDESPHHYPLFRYIAFATFLLLMIDTFADYSLKVEVASAFQKNEIGAFMGPFYGITNALGLVAVLGGTGPLLRFFGVVGLLAVVPLFCLFGNVVLLAVPGLVSAAILRMGQTTFRYSFDNLGRQIAANPLPGNVRRKGKLLIKSVANPLGTAASALILLLIAEPFGLRGVALVAAFLCAVACWVVLRVAKYYRVTLADAVKLKRFGELADELSETDLKTARGLTLQALASEDPETILFGLDLLKKISFESFPEEALRHLESPHPEIRGRVAKLAGDFVNTTVSGALLERLEKELDPGVLAELLGAMAVVKPSAVVHIAGRLALHPHPEVKGAAVRVLFRAGDLSTVLGAGDALFAMIQSSESEARRPAAALLGSLDVGSLEKELRVLINDPDMTVAIKAIGSAAAIGDVNLAPTIVAKLGGRRISLYAAQALVEFGPPSLDHLYWALRFGRRSASRIIVKTIARIPGREAEQILGEIARSGDTFIRSLAASEAMSRAKNMEVSVEFRQDAEWFVLDEAKVVKVLQAAEQGATISVSSKSEINARKMLAIKSLLGWFGVCTRPAEVLSIIPALFPAGRYEEGTSKQAAAIEFLDTLAPDQQLREAISCLDASASGSITEPLEQVYALNDGWLKKVLYADKNGTMESNMYIMDKVMVLRKTRLFETLPGEILQVIAELVEDMDIDEGEVVYD